MTTRGLMLAVLGVVIGAILSILVVEHFDQDAGSRSQPPDPLVVTPENAAEKPQ